MVAAALPWSLLNRGDSSAREARQRDRRAAMTAAASAAAREARLQQLRDRIWVFTLS